MSSFYIQSFIISFVLGVLYFYLAYKTLHPVFKGFIYPMNYAAKIVYVASFFCFGILFFYELGTGIQYFKNYVNGPKWYAGYLLFAILTILCFAVSSILFRLTFLFFRSLSNVNLQVELAKNNLHLAGLVSVYFIVLSFLITEPMMRLVDVLIHLQY
jgi:hypothetical protein